MCCTGTYKKVSKQRQRQNIKDMVLQRKICTTKFLYTDTYPKHGSNEITIQGIHSIVKTTLRRCTYMYNPRTKQYYKNHIDGIVL